MWPGTVFSTTASLSTTTRRAGVGGVVRAPRCTVDLEGDAFLDARSRRRGTARARASRPSGSTSVRYPRRPRFTPRTGVPWAEARATVRSMVPSPPRLTARSTEASSTPRGPPSGPPRDRRRRRVGCVDEHGVPGRRLVPDLHPPVPTPSSHRVTCPATAAASGRSGCTTKAMVATDRYRSSVASALPGVVGARRASGASGASTTAASSIAAQLRAGDAGPGASGGEAWARAWRRNSALPAGPRSG